MRFHGNQLSWAIKHLFKSLYFKYHSPSFICFSTKLAPLIPSLTVATENSGQHVCQYLTPKQWEKLRKMGDHFESLLKIFYMRRCWLFVKKWHWNEERLSGIRIVNLRFFMSFVFCNIKTEHFELKNRSCRHFKENLKLFNLLMDIK